MENVQKTPKVVLITGASSGIGKAMALQYAELKYKLILVARNLASLQSVADECRLKGSTCEVLEMDISQTETHAEKAQKMLGFFGEIDILVNNAGIGQRGLAADTDLAIVRKIMEVNFFGAVSLSHLLLPALRESKGSIIVISSFAGLFGFPLRSSYSASKFALNGYYETLGLEEKEVAVTIACPGRIKTEISIKALAADGSAHGQMDQGQLHGIDVNICAKKIIQAGLKRKKWVFIARGEKLLLLLKKFCPPLFYYLAKRISAK